MNNRGVTLHQLQRFDDAVASYDRAVAVRPDYAEALSNRGVTLHRLQRFEEALASFDRALAVWPDYADALSNRGNTLQQLKRFDAALASYDRALALRPDNAEAHFNKSLLLLLMGDFGAGWPEYEWRWKNKNLDLTIRELAQPLWLGEPAIAGKAILLHSEQGLGDAIQFCRYVPLVATRGARVLLDVPVPLKELMMSLAGVAALISAEDRLPHYYLHCRYTACRWRSELKSRRFQPTSPISLLHRKASNGLAPRLDRNVVCGSVLPGPDRRCTGTTPIGRSSSGRCCRSSMSMPTS